MLTSRRTARLVALMTVLSWLCAGCNTSDSDTVRFALQSAPLTLNPLLATDAASARINRLLYRRLVEFDAANRPVPGIADWRIVSPTHYRFKLGAAFRDFHDGSHLSATDVKATYDAILDPAGASPHRGALTLIERIEVIDPDTVDFHLRHADPVFPGYLVIGIVPARQTNGTIDKPTGSGPFEYLDRPEEGRLRLRRRADGREFEFLRVADPTVRVLKLLRGEIDIMQNDLPPELVTYITQQSDVHTVRATGTNFAYLGFNLRDPDTGRLEIRRAVACAIDREAIIRYVFAGAAHPAAALLPPDHWAGNPSLANQRCGAADARRRLSALGYNDSHPLQLDYKTSNDAFRVRLATILQDQMRAAGIAVDVRSFDWGTFYGDIKSGRFRMFSLMWVGVKTPDIFRYAFHSSSIPPDGANRGGYADAEADRLIEAAEHAPDLASQARIYRTLQAHLLETLPYVPLWYEDHVAVMRDRISGYTLNGDGDYDGLATVRITNTPAAH